MAEQREGGIGWCDTTWNVVRGCSRVSEGCRNCYAERVAARFSGPGMPYEGLATGGKWSGKVRAVREHLEDPLRWRRPRRIFVNSMSDLFHDDLPDVEIANVWSVMEMARERGHTFQLLTKRPTRMRRWVTEHKRWFDYAAGPGVFEQRFAHVWLGVSVENQAAADERIPLLLETPAAVRFVSCEPLLGAVDLRRIVLVPQETENDPPVELDALTGHVRGPDDVLPAKIDWVIAGGESGPGARAMRADWARSLRDQCAAARVPFFFKQWGEWAPMVHLGHITPEGAHIVGDPRLNTGPQVSGASIRVGKKSAGSLLDGVEHKAFPGVPHA